MASVKFCSVYSIVSLNLFLFFNNKFYLLNYRFAMGIEFRESSFLITGKSEAVARKGMVFNICPGFADLKKSAAGDNAAKTYALFIGDTVVVKDGEPAVLLTQLKRRVKHVSVFLKVSVILCYYYQFFLEVSC